MSGPMDHAISPFNLLKPGAPNNEKTTVFYAVQAICGLPHCPNHHEVVDSGNQLNNFHKCKEKFERDGWKIGKKQTDFLCDVHNAEAKKAKAKSIPMSPPTHEPMGTSLMPAKADPPQQPTRVQWDTIAEALDDHYDKLKERYRGDYSDKKVADLAGVGWAYVAEERKRRYGEHDRNDADEEKGRAFLIEVAAKVYVQDAEKLLREFTATWEHRAAEFQAELTKYRKAA